MRKNRDSGFGVRGSGRLPLLLEIGCEEIPARFLVQAQKDFGERLQAALEDYYLLPPCSGSVPTAEVSREAEVGSSPSPVVAAMRTSPLQTYSTPRRLAAYMPSILGRQPDKVEEITGPPVKVAFDAAGKPTRAAQSFAEKNQARVEDLIRVTIPKGEYLAVKKTTQGRPASELLSEILPAVITGLSFPKSMYWTGKSGPRFVRPIRWILALLGEGKQARVIPFEIAGVKSGDTTYGHRSLGQQAIRVQGFNDYAKKLRQSQVEFDPLSRRKQVEQLLKVLLEVLDLKVIPDKELEDWIVNSTERPHALLGSFDDRFSKLPREILITVMRDHQKYFAVEDLMGNLQPRFITVLNRDGDPKGLIRVGHERVLAARFRDAEFFWQADQRVPLRDRLPMLERVTYQAKLGSYADKVRRMGRIAKEVCAALENQGKITGTETAYALRAVQLCKCDLTTQMVQEFTELQGVVGGLYAAAQGEPKEVSEAIYDHYLPQRAEDKCPRSLVGAVVSLADKIDSVVAGFAVGLEPTGSSDPFGLRRAGNGVIRILLERSLPVRLSSVVSPELIRLLHIQLEKIGLPEEEVPSAVIEFLRERLRQYLEQVSGLRYDTVRSVLAAQWWWKEEPLKILQCAQALETIRSSADFVSLSQAAKRIRNILSKSAKESDYTGRRLEPTKLEPGPETQLYEAYLRVKETAGKKREAGDYYGALESFATLRPAVDLFFDKVLVMTDNADVRRNRLQLLLDLDRLFLQDVDLSEIETPAAANVDAST